MEQLTSRERVRMALNHQEPDRLPITPIWFTTISRGKPRFTLGIWKNILMP
ncbi:MAG: hypothetical protein ACOX77_02830 [Caldicoprobacterales bacterium]